jgi:hypothetical protein
LLKAYQNKYHKCQRRKPVAVGSNNVRRGLSSLKASTIFTQATSHVIDGIGHHLITYPTNDEVVSKDEVECAAGGYHNPEAISKDKDANLGANVASATLLNTNNFNKKKQFMQAQDERLLEEIGVGRRKMKLNSAQKAIVCKKIHGVCMPRTINPLTLLLQQISSYMATQYCKGRIGKELLTKAIKAIVDKTINKLQQLQQWQMHIRCDPIGFQDCYMRFKLTLKGQAMHKLAAMQEEAAGTPSPSPWTSSSYYGDVDGKSNVLYCKYIIIQRHANTRSLKQSVRLGEAGHTPGSPLIENLLE